MSKGRNIPEVRFEGFEDEWKKIRFGDIAKLINGRAYKQKELLEVGKYKVLRVGNFYTNDDWYYSDLELPDKYYAVNGDLLYTWSASFGPHIWNGEKVIYHYHIWKVDLSEKLEKLFTVSLLEFDKANILNDSNGSTMVHITKNGLENKYFSIPQPSEQKLIGNHFKDLKKNIKLKETELNKLKNFKQAMLQKMFPKEGESVPEVRFEGFEGEWEEAIIKDLIVKGGSGGTPTSTNRSYYNGDIPFLSISDISKSNGIIKETEKSITKKGLDNSTAYIVPKGSVSLAMYASVGKVAILGIESATSQAFYNMEFNNIDLAEYVYVYLNKVEVEKGWDKLISTGTQANLNADKIKNYNLRIPEQNEMKQVKNYFINLDKNIQSKQAELDKLKQFKQAMLDKMFV